MPAFASPLPPCLLTVLAIAVICDLRSHRVPDPLIAGAIVMALVLQCAAHGMAGATAWLLGAAYAMALFLPLCLSGMLQPGDVKLMGAVGAFVGPVAVTPVAAATVVVGGLLALVMMKGVAALRGQREGAQEHAGSASGPAHASSASSTPGACAGAIRIGHIPFALAAAGGTLAGMTGAI